MLREPRLSPAFWPAGPRTLDWLIDVQQGRFGPLYLGSPWGEVRRLLGRPDRAPWFRRSRCCVYQRFGLWLGLDRQGSVEDIQFAIDMLRSTAFDPPVRVLRHDTTLKRLTLADLVADLGQPADRHGDDDGAEDAQWSQGSHVVYLDLGPDGCSVEGLGLMLPEPEPPDHRPTA